MKVSLLQEIALLKKISLFSSLGPEDLKIIALTTTNAIFEPHEVVFQEGDTGADAYIIFAGRVEVYRSSPGGEAVRLNTLGPGQMFGELALFGDGHRTASVKTVEETYVAIVSKEKLYQILREFPDIGIEMLKVITERFVKAENRLLGIAKR